MLLVNPGLRFLLEISSILLLIISGFSKNKFPVNLLIGLVLPVLFIFLWGRFIAPASLNRAAVLPRLILEFLIYMTTAYVIFRNYSIKWAAAYLIFAVVNSLINVSGEQLVL